MKQACFAAVTMVMAIVGAGSMTSPVVAQAELVTATVPYRQVDGHDILLDVYRPQGDELRPVIVWIHGGALIMGNRKQVHPQVVALAQEEGFALVSIDYRLAPETKLPEIIQDIESAFQWIAQEGAGRFHLDVSRMVVAGESAGGYLTLVTGYRVQPRPRALIALYGYGDLTGPWYSQPSPHPCHNPRKISHEEAIRQTDGRVISDATRRTGNGGLIYLYYRQQGIWPREVSGFDASTISDRIKPFEAVRNVTADYPPTLLIHGTKDTDVPFEQSRMMAEQLEKHGVKHRLISIENGEHGFGGGDPEQISMAYQNMREFVDAVLR